MTLWQLDISSGTGHPLPDPPIVAPFRVVDGRPGCTQSLPSTTTFKSNWSSPGQDTQCNSCFIDKPIANHDPTGDLQMKRCLKRHDAFPWRGRFPSVLEVSDHQ